MPKALDLLAPVIPPILSVAGLMGLLGAVRKATSTMLSGLYHPTTWPELLMPVARLEPGGKGGARSSVAGLIALFGAVRKACSRPNTLTILEPTTWPELLMPAALLE